MAGDGKTNADSAETVEKVKSNDGRREGSKSSLRDDGTLIIVNFSLLLVLHYNLPNCSILNLISAYYFFCYLI